MVTPLGKREGIQESVADGRESLVSGAGGCTDSAHLTPGGGSCSGWPGDAAMGAMVSETVVVVYRGVIPAPRADRIRIQLGAGYRLARRCQLLIEWHRAVTGACSECSVLEQVTTKKRSSLRCVKRVMEMMCVALRYAAQTPQPALSPRVKRRLRSREGRKKKKIKSDRKRKMPPPVPCESSFGNPLIDWGPLGWVSDPATVTPTSGVDGLASATRIKMKAPVAGSVGSPKAHDHHEHRRGSYIVAAPGVRSKWNRRLRRNLNSQAPNPKQSRMTNQSLRGSGSGLCFGIPADG